MIADLHIHGKYSRACSKELTLDNLEKWAKIKGMDLLGTGDFTHPGWIKHLKENLIEDHTGFLKSKSGFPFMLQTEISLIYTQDGKGRRVHNLIFAPSLEIVDQITEAFLKRGRIDYDGRPIFKIPCPEFVEMLKEISKDIEIIPAHIWTPYFGVLGNNSYFNSMKEAFQDQEKNIHAIETGLSSDPEMNWRLSQLDRYSLVSFSDLHSFWPWRIGREATLFDINEDYKNLIKAIRTKQGLRGTIEVDPAYGKYHLDGHRSCNVSLEPKDALKSKNICPKCNKPLTIGVLHRVEELADRPKGYKPKNAKEVYHLIPLSEIISTVTKKGVSTKAVWDEYNKILNRFNNEINVLMNVSFEDLKSITDPKIAKLILNVRKGKVNFEAGYDGVYGTIKEPKAQKGLNDF
ncbi:MAG: endonuclease Q family protein [Nanoarchaeota archaeon]|nr:endonuclease Q family protein [Nanoarchaeota archaeon]MBU4242436.1 endonuclease Q family protein [Nanoarchaeota archaeon]MBU4351570.1 endonuclease Q family protein [Nanoarchaeota archaeon]